MALNPPPIQASLVVTSTGLISQIWIKWLESVRKIASKAQTINKASLPITADVGELAYVPDEIGGAVIAFFDGTNWRRCTDRIIVS